MARGGTGPMGLMRRPSPSCCVYRDRILPDCCQETGVDHAHQHDYPDPDMDDIAA